MEIPEIGIKEVNIPEVYIPEIYNPNPVLPITTNLEIDVAGCTYQHRDIKNTGNTQLLLDDPNGVFLTCGESLFPSFYPIDYTPDQLIITEDLPINSEQPAMPESKQPKVTPPKDEEKIEIKPCPEKNAPFRTGDYRNSKRIERLVKWERSSDLVSCDPVWEKVPFRESFIGSPEILISTAAIGVVAAGSASLVPLIKGVAKSAIKQISKRFNKKTKDKK
tara:strand:- start:240 stop:899 length:660 start_codon:yes stop_codon:yes gene_type:complete